MSPALHCLSGWSSLPGDRTQPSVVAGVEVEEDEDEPTSPALPVDSEQNWDPADG